MKTESVRLAQVTAFERLQPQLEALWRELKELSRKKADSPLNKFKVKLINEKLELANSLLGGESKPFKDFDLFDVDDLPTASDTVILVSQYLESLETWRSMRIVYDHEELEWYWNTKGAEAEVSIKTKAPARSHVEDSDEDENN